MIARVAVDIPLPHLDRLFDYSITESQTADVRPGVRVRVRFAGKLRHGPSSTRIAMLTSARGPAW